MTAAPPAPTGFASDWLALREPVDHASRSRAVEAALFGWLGSRAERDGRQRELAILDLGCGTGSTLRALAPRIAAGLSGIRLRWHLADADAALLAEAERRVDMGAGEGVPVTLHRADLGDAAALNALVADAAPDLVTGSALIDLVSAAWLDRLAEIAAIRRIGLHFALNYSGEEDWSPPHPLDAPVLDGFNAHQRGDKGFGPALGGAATDHLAGALKARGFAVTVGRSDWRLDGGHRALIRMLVAGIAAAAGEGDRIAPADLDIWRKAREESDRVVIGHMDIFAAPPAD